MSVLNDLSLGARRATILLLVLVTIAVLVGWLSTVLAADGFGFADLGMVTLFAGTATLVTLSFWSSLIGALLLRAGHAPAAGGLDTPAGPAAPGTSPVAVLMPVRDEVPEDVFDRLREMQAALDRGRDGERFEYFVLSDSRERNMALREEAAFARWRREDRRPGRLHYRRRSDNRGFKAGNVYDWCVRHGARFDFMVVLDADSVMSGEAIRRLVRIMETTPTIGILQPLIVGLPTTSAFARLFQFGMRHGMRAYATGCAWWQADEGPFWGHNAVVRTRPFIEHCALPTVPGTGPLAGDVLSHDQVEAVLMRAGGHEVRVLPIEDGSLEQTPPTLPDFVGRDLRWCQGNMQYLKLLDLPGLRPLGRLQLAVAIMLFLASPMWLGFLALGLGQALGGNRETFIANVDPVLGIGLFVVMMTMTFAPKLIGVAEAVLSSERSESYGGRARLLAGAGIETLFSMLLGPIMAVAHTVFIGGLAFGRKIRWRAQARNGRRISLGEAARGLWPQTMLGVSAALLLALEAPTLLPWAAPLLAGLILAIPFACLTSSPRLGALLAQSRLCATPEEVADETLSRPSAAPARLRPQIEVVRP
jgi:membrane glycosyltransferase